MIRQVLPHASPAFQPKSVFFLVFRWIFFINLLGSSSISRISSSSESPKSYSLNSGRMPSNTAPGIAACRKNLTDLSMMKLFGNSVWKILTPVLVLRTRTSVNFANLVSNLVPEHLEELPILRHMVFFISIFVEKYVSHRPAKFGQFSTKSWVRWRHKIGHI